MAKKPEIIKKYTLGAQLFTDPFTKKPIIEVPLNQFFGKDKVIGESWPEVVAALEEARNDVGWPETTLTPSSLVAGLDSYFANEGLYLILGLKDKQQLSLLIIPYVEDRFSDVQGFEGETVMFPRQPWMVSCTKYAG